MVDKNKYGVGVFLKTIVPILIISVVLFLQLDGVIDGNQYKVSKDNGIWSIITGPFLHAGLEHLIGNIVPLLICLPLLASYYSKDYSRVLIIGFLTPAIVMYMLEISCVGISGMTYAIIWFLIIAGIRAKSRSRFFIGISLGFFYGGLIQGATVLAGDGIAWQAHAIGLGAGISMALSSKTLKKI
jgi:membrane associated rhomboid family serine protease